VDAAIIAIAVAGVMVVRHGAGAVSSADGPSASVRQREAV
jgi:anthranilate phosphoribosyltransferase